MKKLTTLKLHNAVEMTDNEMKYIVGGYYSGMEATSCSTTCPDGTTVEITDCIGECKAVDGKYVRCTGPSTRVEKPCGGYATEGGEDSYSGNSGIYF